MSRAKGDDDTDGDEEPELVVIEDEPLIGGTNDYEDRADSDDEAD